MLTRRQVLGFRMRAQQLDRDSGTIDDTAVLDLGVQDTGTDGARWALTLRGVEHPSAADLATVWTRPRAPRPLSGPAGAPRTSTAARACRGSPRRPRRSPMRTRASGSSTPPSP